MLRSTSQLVELWPLFRDALTASSINDVQRLNAIAQKELDIAIGSIRLQEAGDPIVAAFQTVDSGATLLERALRVLTASSEGTLVDIAKVGVEAAESVTGHTVTPGAGAQFLIQRSVATVFLDIDRFERTVAETSEFCRLADFTSVLQSDQALAGIAASQRRLAEAVLAFEAILKSEVDEDTIFRRLLKYHAEVFEEVGGPLFSWYLLLSGTKSKPYEKLIREGVNSLSRSIDAAERLAPWFDGRESFIRDAASHVGGFHLEGGTVHITLGRVQVSHPVGWFVDQIYAFLESMMATSWSLYNELDRRNIEIPISEADKRYLGMTSFATAEMFALTSFEALECRDTDGAWHFSLPPGEDDALIKAMVLIGIDPRISSVTVERSGGAAQLQAPFEALESYFNGVDSVAIEEQIVTLVEYRGVCTIDGEPVVTEADVRFAVAGLGASFFAGDNLLVPLLRRLDRVAVTHRFSETHDRIVRALRTIRTDDAAERERLSQDFRLWLGTPPEVPKATNVRLFRTATE